MKFFRLFLRRFVCSRYGHKYKKELERETEGYKLYKITSPGTCLRCGNYFSDLVDQIYESLLFQKVAGKIEDAKD